MGNSLKFFTMMEDASIFKFQIDTRNIVSGATNGSQLDNQFILPIDSLITSLILKVNDGRADTIISSSSTAGKTVTFSTPGIYELTLIGKAVIRFSSISPDARKMIWTSEFGGGFKIGANAFETTINMTWDVPFVRFTNLTLTFSSSKTFGPRVDLTTYVVDEVETASFTFRNFQTALTTVFSGFFPKLTNATSFYRDAPLSMTPEVQIIAPNLTTAQSCFYSSGMRGRIVIKSNVLSDISGLCGNIANPPSLGEVDIRNVTNATNFITKTMTTANVNSTLLGWVNNFDWSGIPTVTNKVTLDFYNSKYSNNTAVINAKAFLEAKGIVFTNLTMA